ncbi:phosphonopyruvate decarboxylase [Puteibacter caeruleilacunae]|nr:phosphonopyruvate decarboxylase [Puteibacter caeruleilacunae]
MIDPKKCLEVLKENGINFYTGVPDSTLTNFTACLAAQTTTFEHITAANEGAAIGLAVGSHLASGDVSFVYMQNSGIGNAVNPLLSLADKMVYQIPMILMIGWRGEPGVKDEPQHTKQGAVTLELLESMRIPFEILSEDEQTAFKQIEYTVVQARKNRCPHALVVRPSLFEKYDPKKAENNYSMSREDALHIITDQLKNDALVVATTGKLSRELFEYREALKQKHNNDFLVVGGMGHASSIALGVALHEKKRRVICLDGDGAMLMHTGALSNVGDLAPGNFVHIVMNNGAHESVGGQPTLGYQVDFCKVAEGFNYQWIKKVETSQQLVLALMEINEVCGPVFLEIRVGVRTRKELGRPTILPVEGKNDFMNNLQQK